MRFTAIIERDEDGIYVGQIEEVPAAISQGQTLEELRENLQDALELIFSINREQLEIPS
ncbi:MAG: type II toxin-antitoxin system HicB family antitoxin [Saprospiraceae bacterium]